MQVLIHIPIVIVFVDVSINFHLYGGKSEYRKIDIMCICSNNWWPQNFHHYVELAMLKRSI